MLTQELQPGLPELTPNVSLTIPNPNTADLAEWQTTVQAELVAAEAGVAEAQQLSQAWLNDYQSVRQQSAELTEQEFATKTAALDAKWAASKPWDMEEAAKATLTRRRDQLSWARKGVIEGHYDESGRGPLDDYFPADSLDLDSTFSLPPNEQPPTDPEEAVRQLNSLPYVAVTESRQSRQHPEVVMHDVPVSLGRVIGSDSFASWAGRGTADRFGRQTPDGGGSKNLHVKSRDAIVKYAQEPKEGSAPDLEVVRDAAGEHWAIAREGTHRTAAAKLRGQESIICAVTIPAEADMLTLPFSVREQFANGQNRLSV